MMTDLETLEKLFQKIGFIKGPLDGTSTGTKRYGIDKTDEGFEMITTEGAGYCGFVAEWKFDPEGNLKEHSLWE